MTTTRDGTSPGMIKPELATDRQPPLGLAIAQSLRVWRNCELDPAKKRIAARRSCEGEEAAYVFPVS